MKIYQKIGILGYILTAVISFGFGSTYLIRDRFMPYHADAIGMKWEQIPSELQYVIMALIHITGAGWLSLAIAIGFFAYYSSKSLSLKADLAIFITCICLGAATMIASATVSFHTNGKPPWFMALAALLLMALAFTCTLIYKIHDGKQDR